MSIIYIDNNINDIDESFILVSEGLVNQIKMASDWKTRNDKQSISKFTSSSLTDEEYNKLKSDIEIMKTAEDYSEYKKALSRFCYFCNIAPRGLILRKYQLTKGKGQADNKIDVEYINNTKKITLPEDTKLYHMTKVAGIKELNPVFRGKSVKGYLYDKPRVYFTIRKNMPKFLADYKPNEKMHLYLCKSNINQVYVDPLVPNFLQGAVYVESNTPIPVEEITESNKDKILSMIGLGNKNKDSEKTDDKNTESVKEEFDFEDFYTFVTENGLELEN